MTSEKIHSSLFSGVGGWSIASDQMGWSTAFMCEWGKNKQYILKHHWPNAEIYGDIITTDFKIWRGRIDILTASTPCQPFSLAGKRAGADDVRHLWPETIRALREIQPQWFVLENVPGLVNWSKGMVFREIITDLENEGYEVLPFLLPACSVNAPHKRERIWIVAHNKNSRRGGNKSQSGGLRSVEQIHLVYSPRISENGNKQETSNDAPFSCREGEEYGGGSYKQGQARQQEGEPENCNAPGELSKQADAIRRHGMETEREMENRNNNEREEGGPRNVFYERRSIECILGSKEQDAAYGSNPGNKSLQQSEIGTDKSSFTPDSTGEGQQERQSDNRRQDSEKNRTGMDNRLERSGSLETFADSDKKGCKGDELRRTLESEGIESKRECKRQPFESTSQLYQTTNWLDFPSVSPLRSGDDGFSRDALRLFINENSGGLLTEKEVDQIIQKSLNKWNNETIAAGGDAVVPGVVLQIFKAINEYTNLDEKTVSS